MKNLIITVMLFLGAISYGQEMYSNNTWAIKNVTGNSRVSATNRLLTTVSEDLCHDIFTIGADIRYIQLNEPSDNRIGLGTNFNNLTQYSTVGDFRSNINIRDGWYNSSQGLYTQITNESDPYACLNTIEIRSAHYTRYNDDLENVVLNYRLGNAEQVRIRIENLAGRAETINFPEYHGDSEIFLTPQTREGQFQFRVPKRRIGDVYKITVDIAEDNSVVAEHYSPTVEGVRIISIDSRGLQFIVARNNDDGWDNLWLDRKPRVRGQESHRRTNRFKTRSHATQDWTRLGRTVKKYTIPFASGEFLPYETLALVVERSNRRFSTVSQLNGPVIRWTWHANYTGGSTRSDDSYNLAINYRVTELPPGWNASDMTLIDGEARRTYTDDSCCLPYSAEGGDNVQQGNQNSGLWEFMDNEWEFGHRFRYAGHTYLIKMWDHVSHDDDRLGTGNQRNNRDDRGGVFNNPTSEGMIIGNIDHSGSHATTNGNHNGRDLNFNTSW